MGGKAVLAMNYDAPRSRLTLMMVRRGVKKDPAAARQYYETAANLGDTDAMEEAAWCLMEGFGGGKDKVRTSHHHLSLHALRQVHR
jgi:TPR repeat protein